MVLGPRPLRTLVVPDEQALTLWGHDPSALGLEPDLTPARAERVLVVDALPPVLGPALRELLSDVPHSAEVIRVDVRAPSSDRGELGWRDLDELLAGGAQHDGRDHHADHDGGHDPGGMMAIVGEPSSDGLVMERIELEHGPLGLALPGGLVLRVELDGDVVVKCDVDQALVVPRSAEATVGPDPVAGASWRAAIDEALGRDRGGSWSSLVAIEIERALSHLAWLRSFAGLLGWPELRRRCQPAIDPVLTLYHASDQRDEDFASAHAAAVALERWLTPSRRLRFRTLHRGRVNGRDAHALVGPVARACGLAHDARIADERYRELGFAPVIEAGGDARARTLVRLREVVQSIELARGARQAGTSAPAPPRRTAIVEGPRGAISARSSEGGLLLKAAALAATRRAAGDAAVGHEWAAALVTLASFDLSPWRVGP